MLHIYLHFQKKVLKLQLDNKLLDKQVVKLVQINLNDFLIKKFLKAVPSEYNYSFEQLENIKYSLLTVLSESEKLIILSIIFLTLGKFNELIIVALALSSIRVFAGGLHFAKFWSCFAFTLIFFILCILVMPNIFYLSNEVRIIALSLGVIVNFMLAPICSKHRPIYSKERKMRFRLISTALTILTAFFAIKNNPFQAELTWVVILQNIQLIFAKLLEAYQKKDRKNALPI